MSNEITVAEATTTVTETVSVTKTPVETAGTVDQKPGAFEKMQAKMKHDSKNIAVWFLVATNLLTSFHYAHAAFGDVRDSVTVNGSYGPLSYIANEKLAAPDYGPTQTVFHAGEKVSYVTNLCLAKNVSITGRAELVRPAQSGVAETIIDRHVTDVGPSMHRCGPRIGFFEFPKDSLPGTYEIRRSVAVDNNSKWNIVRLIWPLEMDMDPLIVQLVTTSTPTGPTASKPPVP